jgi:DHA2 family multidrug resistance protein
MPPEASNQVSGMVNLMRNVGGSIGISAVTTLIARHQQTHHQYLARNTFEFNPRLQQILSEMTDRFSQRTDSTEALRQAYGRVSQMLQQQATVLAYIDTFWIMGALCLIGIVPLFFAKRSKPGQAPAAH